MPTPLTHTLPIPLPESPEATGTLTNLLKALEANGLCFVHQAVIVETDNWNTYRLIDELVNPPAPEPVLIPATNGTGQAAEKATDEKEPNVYTNALTNEVLTVGALRQALRFKRLPLGAHFYKTTKTGQILMIVFETEEGKYALRKAHDLES